MSSVPAASPVVDRSGERRSHERFPIALSADYRIHRKGRVDSGSARTINIASGGVLLEANESLATGGPIDLFIRWPIRLEGTCPLNLVISGRIIRSDSRGVAIKANHHEFRTAGIRRPPGQSPHVKVRSITG